MFQIILEMDSLVTSDLQKRVCRVKLSSFFLKRLFLSTSCTCRYVGFYNAVHSAGAAVAWQIDMHKTSLIIQLIVNWALMTISCPLLVLLLLLAVKD